MQVEIIRGDLSSIADRWDELARSDGRDGFFRTAAWYQCWMKHVRPEAEPYVVVVKDRDGRIVGLAPLCRLPYRDLGFRMTGLAWAGREVVSGDFLDFVSEPDDRSRVIAALLGFLWEMRREWGMLLMSELVKYGDSYSAVQGLARETGLPLRSQEERICPYIALPATFDAYLAGLSSSSRYHIRRRTREITKKGGRVEVFSQGAEIVPRLENFIELHRVRWQRDGQPGTLGRPGFAAFLKEICSAPPSGSKSRLYQLIHDGKSVASLLTFSFGKATLYYQAGWDPESPLAAHSPGAVLMAQSIRDAIEEGSEYYEFLRGDEAYKSRWTKTYRTTATLILARSFVAKRYLNVARLKDHVKVLLNIGDGSKSKVSPDSEEAPDSGDVETGGKQQPRHASL